MPHAGNRRKGVVLAAGYSLLAVSPVPIYLLLRHSSQEYLEYFEGTSAVDAYLGVGLLYYGAAAACAFMLFAGRSGAKWAAWFVATWAGLGQLSYLVYWLRTDASRWPSPIGLIVFALLVAMAVRATCLERPIGAADKLGP